MGMVVTRTIRARLGVGIAAGAMALACASPAAAVGMLFSERAAPELDVQVAIAANQASHVSWVRVQLAPVGGQALWVLPLPADAAVDVAGDAWMDALDRSLAPRITAPIGARSCSKEDARVDSLATALPRHAARALLHFDSAAAVTDHALKAGLRVDDSALDALKRASTDRFLALEFSAPSAWSVGDTVRFSQVGGSRALEILATDATGPVNLTVYTAGSGLGWFGDRQHIQRSELDDGWDSSTARSAYADSVESKFYTETEQGRSAYVVEAFSSRALTAWAVSSEVTVPPILHGFATGVTSGAADADRCTSAIAGILDAGMASFPVACAEGAVQSGDDATCDAAATDALSCEGYRDVALALSGATVVPRFTRIVGRVVTGYPIEVEFDDASDIPVVSTASYADESACPGNPPPPGVGGFGGTYGGYGGGDGGATTVVESYDSQTSYVFDCSGSPEPEGSSSSEDDCGGDTSDSYDDEDDCGGDSSDSYDDDDCGGDSSDSYDDSDCGGDSSDGYDDSGCSGDSSGSEGPDCGGDSSSSGEGCSVRRRSRRRASVWTLAGAGLLLPLRRFSGAKRRRRRIVRRRVRRRRA